MGITFFLFNSWQQGKTAAGLSHVPAKYGAAGASTGPRVFLWRRPFESVWRQHIQGE